MTVIACLQLPTYTNKGFGHVLGTKETDPMVWLNATLKCNLTETRQSGALPAPHRVGSALSGTNRMSDELLESIPRIKFELRLKNINCFALRHPTINDCEGKLYNIGLNTGNCDVEGTKVKFIFIVAQWYTSGPFKESHIRCVNSVTFATAQGTWSLRSM